MNANLSVFKKGLLLVSIPLLSQLLLLGILAMVRTDQAEAQQWAIHTKDVIAQAEAVHRLAVEAQSSVRGFVLTSDPRFVEQFRQVRSEAEEALAELDRSVEDNAEQRSLIASITRQANDLMAWLGTTLELQRAGNRDAALARVQSLEGTARVERLRAMMRQFQKHEEELDDQRVAHLAETSRRQNLVLLAGVAITLVSAALLLLAFTRGIGRRLVGLTSNIRALAAGREMTPAKDGTDEISLLDRAFHDMADALAQKSRENEMFVYSVSHDLRAPLVNLQGFSQELALVCADLRKLVTAPGVPAQSRDRAVALLDRDAAEAVRFIQTAVRRLEGIINALLRLSRVGRVEYQRQLVDTALVVKRVVESLADTVQRRGATVTVGSLPAAWADPQALDQVFANLIGNAVNYLAPDRPGIIEVGAAQDVPGAPPRTIVFYVKDNGLGIPAEYQDKVFLAFQRLHPDAAPGEGIGLALVQRVVERHGGKIWLESAVGVGTTFYVALPLPPALSDGKLQEAAA